MPSVCCWVTKGPATHLPFLGWLLSPVRASSALRIKTGLGALGPAAPLRLCLLHALPLRLLQRRPKPTAHAPATGRLSGSLLSPRLPSSQSSPASLGLPLPLPHPDCPLQALASLLSTIPVPPRKRSQLPFHRMRPQFICSSSSVLTHHSPVRLEPSAPLLRSQRPSRPLQQGPRTEFHH